MAKTTKSEANETKETKQTGKFLSQVTTAVKARPLGLVIHGVPSVGKTSFAAAMPAPVFIIDSHEQGIHDLKRYNRLPADIPVMPTIQKWEDLLAALDELAKVKHPFKSVVIDSLTGFQTQAFRYVCDKEYKSDWSKQGFLSYSQGPKTTAKRYWPELIDKLEAVRDRGCNVCLIAHSRDKSHSNPRGDDYVRYVPYLETDIWQATHRWAECVLFLDFAVKVDKSKGIKGKGEGGEKRQIYTEYNAAYDAKNRFGLPPVLPMGTSGAAGWKAFADEARKKLKSAS
jgi:hypothetical protein